MGNIASSLESDDTATTAHRDWDRLCLRGWWGMDGGWKLRRGFVQWLALLDGKISCMHAIYMSSTEYVRVFYCSRYPGSLSLYFICLHCSTFSIIFTCQYSLVLLGVGLHPQSYSCSISPYQYLGIVLVESMVLVFSFSSPSSSVFQLILVAPLICIVIGCGITTRTCHTFPKRKNWIYTGYKTLMEATTTTTVAVVRATLLAASKVNGCVL